VLRQVLVVLAAIVTIAFNGISQSIPIGGRTSAGTQRSALGTRRSVLGTVS
jgi:hypothetical protein